MTSPIKKREGSLCKHNGTDSQGHKSLLERLKEKGTSITESLEAFNSHSESSLSFNEFQVFLNQFNVPFTAFDIAQLFSKYSKNNVISIASLKKLLATRASSASKSFALSPYKRAASSLNIEKSILDKTCDSVFSPPSPQLLEFWKNIREKLDTPEIILDFFFVKRNDDITIEEFKDSCESLLPSSLDPELIFLEISEKHNYMTKSDFIKVIDQLNRTKTQEALSTLRARLKKKYKTFIQAYEDLKKSSKCLYSDSIFQSLNLKKSNACTNLPDIISKHQFKKIWYGKDNLCRVDSCTEKIEEYEFCDQHFKCFILRGEEALGKISASVDPEKCVGILTSLLLSLKRGTPFILSNVHKRDVQALQLFLKYRHDKKEISVASTPCSIVS